MHPMRYMLLIYGDPSLAASMTPEEGEKMMADYYTYTQRSSTAARSSPATRCRASRRRRPCACQGGQRTLDRRSLRRDQGGARRLLPRRREGPRPRPRAGGAATRCAPRSVIEVRPLLDYMGSWWSPLAGSSASSGRSRGRCWRSLIRFTGDFDLAEEALQEAFVVALERWSAMAYPTARAPGCSRRPVTAPSTVSGARRAARAKQAAAWTRRSRRARAGTDDSRRPT